MSDDKFVISDAILRKLCEMQKERDEARRLAEEWRERANELGRIYGECVEDLGQPYLPWEEEK